MKHKSRSYKFLFAAYLRGLFIDIVEAGSLNEAKKLLKYQNISFDRVESI